MKLHHFIRNSLPYEAMNTASQDRIAMKKEEVCKRLSISPRTLENMVREGSFPPPARIGRYVYWSDVCINEWRKRVFGVQEAWRPR